MLDKFKSLALKYDLGDNKQYRTSATGVVEKSKKWISQLKKKMKEENAN